MTYLKCLFSRGAFSGEVVFEVQPNGEKHVGVASRRYCRTVEGASFSDVNLEKPVEGILVVRVLDEKEDEVLVSMPDGEVTWASNTKIFIQERTRDVFIRPRSPVGD